MQRALAEHVVWSYLEPRLGKKRNEVPPDTVLPMGLINDIAGQIVYVTGATLSFFKDETVGGLINQVAQGGEDGVWHDYLASKQRK